MHALILGLMLAAVEQPAQSGTPAAAPVSLPADADASDHRYAHPEWIRLPSADDMLLVFPKAALAKGHEGQAIIECELEPQGTLERCKAISEQPAGEGFGEAALLLAPGFAMKPATEQGEPIQAHVRIPIKFKVWEPGRRREVRSVPMVSEPVWASAPSFDDMKAAWPKEATAATGHVSMHCGLTRAGALRNCEVMMEAPPRQGFGRAAKVILAPKFRMRVAPEIADKIANATVNLPIHFNNPTLGTRRVVVEPKWIAALDPAKVQAVYPAKAADAGVKSGKGFADCAVVADGHLADCKPAGAEPDGMGFAEAAVQVASMMQMNPWTGGGGPVDGVRIRLPIAFNLAPETAPEPAPAKP